MTDRCRDCDQAVLWVTSMSGTRYTLDANPSYSGKGFFLAAGTDDQGKPTRLAIPVDWLDPDQRSKVERRGLRLFRTHMLTCPAARARRTVAA